MCTKSICNDANEPFLPPTLPPSMLAIPPTSPLTSAIADSGATTNLLRQSSSHLFYQDPANQPIFVALPNNQLIQSLQSGNLLPHVHQHSLPAYTFADSDLQHNLLSLSSITNIGCNMLLTSTAIDITLGNQLVYHGSKIRPTTYGSSTLINYSSVFSQYPRQPT